MVYKTEGLVLRSRDLGEADKVVTLYTREYGKVAAVARGARRPRNRLMGATQVFTHGRYMLFKGKQLDTLNQGEIVQSNQRFREDLDLMGYAMYLSELVDVLVEEGEPNADLFVLLLNSMELGASGRFLFALRVFELRFMKLLGYEPQLGRCLGCGTPITGDAWFSAEGGVVCSTCRTEFTRTQPCGVGTREWMKLFISWDLDRLAVLHPNEKALTDIEKLNRAYFDFRLERPLKSLAFLQTLKRP